MSSPSKLLEAADEAVRDLSNGAFRLECEDAAMFLVKSATGERVKLPTANGKSHSDHPDASARVSSLSDRERQFFSLLGDGNDMHQIAQLMGVSVKTIETYRARVKRKLEIGNRVRLLTMAVEWKLHQASSDGDRQ